MNSEPRKSLLVALGANLSNRTGDNAAAVEMALGCLSDLGEVIKISSLWRNPAYPAGAGPDFVNACARLESDLAPEDVLSGLHRIEASMGRRRAQRWGPRAIDMDLLAQEDTVTPDPDTARRWMDLSPSAQPGIAPDRLILPHPRLQDRAFVLIPLAEIAPDWRHPLLGRTAAEMALALGDPAGVGMSRL